VICRAFHFIQLKDSLGESQKILVYKQLWWLTFSLDRL
jgi:hypothetical protein